LVLVALLCTGFLGPVATATDSTSPSISARGAITGVYPNPATDGDRGECVVVHLPSSDGGNWSLSDGEDVLALPSNRSTGRIAISEDPTVACRRTNATSIAVDDALELSNAGETVALRTNGTVVDSVTYPDAPEARWYRNGSWHPLGETDFDAATVEARNATVFVLPDAPSAPVAPIRNASSRIFLAGYSFTSERVTRMLRAAANRGVEVRVLLDASPVGGLTRREARLLDDLTEAGVEVRVLGGPRARYAFHHAKYAVVDDRAVVLTENWKPAGVGGRSSRGWGVVLDEPTADRLTRVFEADASAPDALRWQDYRTDHEFAPARERGSTRSFPTRFRPRRVPADRVEVLVSPDNAGSRTIDLLRSADDSIRIEQVRIDGRNDPFLQATLAAARRGVSVEILLSSAWYTREDNRRLAKRLRRLADREDLALSVRLTDPRSEFEKVHAKGVVVDGDVAIVGSLNWNEESWRRNREVVLAVHSPEAAAYFERVFRADWRGGAWRLTVGFLAGVALACLVAVGVLRRWVSFDRSV
jgi:phosphatidylserine/phosphatidylglycerophosphate/cardiolipin synthase-like enzyme